MSAAPLLQKVDAVTVPVSDLEAGLRFYRDSLGHELRWRNDRSARRAWGLLGSDTEIVLTTRQAYEPNWLVSSADYAVAAIEAAGGRVVTEPFHGSRLRWAAAFIASRQGGGTNRRLRVRGC